MFRLFTENANDLQEFKTDANFSQLRLQVPPRKPCLRGRFAQDDRAVWARAPHT
jgi:hypothetical protein